MKNNKIWNGKLKGGLTAILLGLIIIVGKIRHIFTTILFCNNIGSAGKNIKIMKGLKYRYPKYIIRKKSVIGTGTVVTKDVPDYAIVAGNPARIIKYIR